MSDERTALDVISVAVVEKMDRMGYTARFAAVAAGVSDNAVPRPIQRSPGITWGQLLKFAAWVDLEIKAVPRGEAT